MWPRPHHFKQSPEIRPREKPRVKPDKSAPRVEPRFKPAYDYPCFYPQATWVMHTKRAWLHVRMVLKCTTTHAPPHAGPRGPRPRFFFKRTHSSARACPRPRAAVFVVLVSLCALVPFLCRRKRQMFMTSTGCRGLGKLMYGTDTGPTPAGTGDGMPLGVSTIACTCANSCCRAISCYTHRASTHICRASVSLRRRGAGVIHLCS